jgi:hypothetical protein
VKWRHCPSPCHILSKQSPIHASDDQLSASHHKAPFRARIIPFVFRDTKNLARVQGFLQISPYPCQHTYTSVTYLDYDHLRRHIIYSFCNVINYIFVCLFQEYQWRARSERGVGGCLRIQSVPDSNPILKIRTSLGGQTGNWYIIIPAWNFTGITLLSLW